jgi:thymidylate synthase
MRSNDVILGLPTDIAFFAVLQSQMLAHLKWHGGAEYQELELGTYTHIANSFHIYERHFELADKMITRKFEPIEIPKVDQSLIVKTGETSASFAALFDNPNILTNDPLFAWIQKNIKL